MQTHREDLVELTLMWDRDDYRRCFWHAHDRAEVIKCTKFAVVPTP